MRITLVIALLLLLLCGCGENAISFHNKYNEPIPSEYEQEVIANVQTLVDINRTIKKLSIIPETVLYDEAVFDLYCTNEKQCHQSVGEARWSLMYITQQRYHIAFEFHIKDNSYYECLIDQNDEYPHCTINTWSN